MKKTAIIFTGGTISMKVDKRLAAAVPGLSSEEIMSMVTNIDKLAEIEPIKFGKFPGPHMTPDKIWELATLVKETVKRDDIDSVVITHGTDSMEETAYYLDLNVNTDKPIVFVAAMRNSSELGYDGPANIASAVLTANCEESRGKGVLVVMNNEINAASEVTKSNTLSLNTFQSLEFGPLGIVDNDKALYFRKMMRHDLIETDGLEKNVHLLKSYVGMDSGLFKYLVSSGAKGIVLEAMGRGNIPPEAAMGVKYALENDVVVVIVSRCPTGRVLDTYGYPGGGKELRNMGAFFGGHMNGQKMRIKLMLALAKTSDKEEIRKIIEMNQYN